MHPVLRKFSKRRPRTYGLILLALGAVLAKFGQWGAASSIPSLWVAMVLGIVFGILGSSFSSWARNTIPIGQVHPMSQVQKKLNRGRNGAPTPFIAHGAVTGRFTITPGKYSRVSEQGRSIFFIQRTACSTFPISSSMTPPSESSSESGENAGSRLNL